MRLGVFVTVLLLGFGFASHGTAQIARERADREADRVCFYLHVNYEGAEWCYRPGDELADLGNRRNEISSIRIFGRARVTVFDQRDFAGQSEEFTADVADLTLRSIGGSRTWNDRIDSFQVSARFERPSRGEVRRAGRSYRDGMFGRRGGVCVYEFADYRGRSECWESGEEERNLNRLEDWNDRISSIRVFGRARALVYRDKDHRGGHLEVTRDIRNLAETGWDDQISSIDVR